MRDGRLGRETYLADLYRQSVQALTRNRTEWMGLLSSVSKYYKMSFDKNVLIYSATLSAAMRIIPDEKNPTAAGNVMKSGYGINMTASAKVVSGAPSGYITEPQTAVAYFPEFQYTDYWRLLERTSPGYSAAFQFRVNEYSTYGRRTHFTPVWFPDGNYTVYAQVMDAWTPAGMLQIHLNDTLTVHGNLFSDWHVRPAN